MIVFAASCIIMPFANQITGSAYTANNTANCTSMEEGLGSGSGCGSGLGPPNVTLDFCQQREVRSGEGESVMTLLPISVWAVVLILLLVLMVSRYVHIPVSVEC